MMPKNRLEAFSDGVIAVAITLLALNLPIPAATPGRDLASTLGHDWPNFAAFVASFATIGIIWINHHAMLRRIARVDHTTLVLNTFLLMTVCLLPFSTALLAEYLTASSGQKLAAAIYGGSFTLMSLGFLAMQRHVLVAHPELLHEQVTPEVREKVLKRNRVGLLPYAIATAAAAISGYLTYGISLAIAIYYGIPRTTADVAERELPS
ncbi:MAG TPA: TMEM175 family protein [Solirubrobacteraceae bacterium]|jgi:uncharacterized membrane protein|nr:TMEM175 family protein [Solirubrobacteraceae bacterium]